MRYAVAPYMRAMKNPLFRAYYANTAGIAQGKHLIGRAVSAYSGLFYTCVGTLV